jgi:hypothetical protein
VPGHPCLASVGADDVVRAVNSLVRGSCPADGHGE